MRAIVSSGKGSGADGDDVRREHVRQRGFLRKAHRDGDRRSSRPPSAPQHGHVRVGELAREDVHVDVGALGIAEADGAGLRTSAEELLPQHGRELVRSADGEHVLARPGRLDLPQQLADGSGEEREPEHQRRRE